MHFIRWLGFAWRGGGVINTLHLFPIAREITAPYPVQCRVSILRARDRTSPMQIDGVQLGNGFSLPLDEVFPAQEEREGVYGVKVEMTTNQPHFDLSPSFCVLEGTYESQRTRFTLACQPEVIAGEARHFYRKRSVAPIIATPSLQTSLVVVNGSESAFVLAAEEALPLNGGWDLDGFPELAIAGESTREIALTERQHQSGSVALPSITDEGIVCYAVFRDRTTRRPVSVFSM